MVKKIKSTTCSIKGWCNNHLLILQPLEKELFFRKVQKFRLCPKLNKYNNNFQKTIPLFHKDSKFYTPSFILEEQKKFYHDNDQRVKRKHLIKLQQVQSKSQQIMVPKHARRKNYCAVCRNGYQDYLEHIQSLEHHKCIETNKFNSDIKYLTQYFQNNNNKQNKQQLQNNKQQLQQIIPQQSSSDLLLMGLKKIVCIE